MKGANRLAEEITIHLLTMNYGDSNSELGDRLAIMKNRRYTNSEIEIGGRCRNNVFRVISEHLRRHKVKEKKRGN